MTTAEYSPSEPLNNPEASKYVPKFLHSGVANASGRPDVRIRDDFYGTRRKLRIAVVGAGGSGLQFLHDAQRLKDVEIVVYDRNEEVGGVWCSTTYPGCRCDFPSFVYQFRWHPYAWSEVYAAQPELLQYFKDVARENDFYKHIKLRHEVLRASWNDDSGKWKLNIRDLATNSDFVDTFDLFVHLRGAVCKPKPLRYPGLENFAGRVVHPSYWPNDLSVAGKRVAVIGHGSTGVQILPNLINDVEAMYTWFRSATHIIPPVAGENFRYSEEQRKLLVDPDVILAYRKAFEGEAGAHSGLVVNGSELALGATWGIGQYMEHMLSSKPEIVNALVPKDFTVSCRRPAFNVGYLEALVNPKTTVLPKPPKQFTEHGILDEEGVEHALDMVVTATGYDQSHKPHIPLFVNGKEAAKDWEIGDLGAPPCYFGVLYAGVPNYLATGSTFLPVHAGNFFQLTETTSKYIVSLIDKMQLDRIISIEPKAEAVEQFVRHSQAWVKRTAMGGPCNAWYKGNDGNSKPPCLWPGQRDQFIKAMAVPRFEDFNIVYEDAEDRYAYLGNGWDLDTFGYPEADKSWYLGQPQEPVPEEVLDKLRKKVASVDGVPPTSGNSS